MKLTVFFWLGLCTLILASLAVMGSYKVSLSLIFMITLLGQGVWIYTVFRVLKDNYSTDKTFEDFYEDRPDLGK